VKHINFANYYRSAYASATIMRRRLPKLVVKYLDTFYEDVFIASDRLPYGAVLYMLDETRSIAVATVCKLANFPSRSIKSGETWPKRRHLLLYYPPLFLFGFYCLLSEYFRTALKRLIVLRRIARGRYTLLSVALITLYARLTPLILCTSGRRAKLSPGISKFHVEIYHPSPALRSIPFLITRLYLY